MFIEQIDNRLSFSLFSMWTEHAVYLYTQQHWNEEFVYILSSIVQLKTIKTHLPKQKKMIHNTVYSEEKKWFNTKLQKWSHDFKTNKNNRHETIERINSTLHLNSLTIKICINIEVTSKLIWTLNT